VFLTGIVILQADGSVCPRFAVFGFFALYCLTAAFADSEAKRGTRLFVSGLLLSMPFAYFTADEILTEWLTGTERALTLLCFPMFLSAISCLIAVVFRKIRFSGHFLYVGTLLLSVFSILSVAGYLTDAFPVAYLSPFAAAFILTALFSAAGKFKLPPSAAGAGGLAVWVTRPFFTIPPGFETEYYLLGFALYLAALCYIWRGKRAVLIAITYIACAAALFALFRDAVTNGNFSGAPAPPFA
jgi:hypothetical protein